MLQKVDISKFKVLCLGNVMVEIVDAFLRGLEKPLLLWLLAHGPKNGYELIKEVKRLTGRASKPSVIYPYLYWLEEGGFVVSERLEKGRRELKFYRLTDNGRELLHKMRSFFRNPIKRMISDLMGEHTENRKIL